MLCFTHRMNDGIFSGGGDGIGMNSIESSTFRTAGKYSEKSHKAKSRLALLYEKDVARIC